jgi:hypothetical protein
MCLPFGGIKHGGVRIWKALKPPLFLIRRTYSEFIKSDKKEMLALGQSWNHRAGHERYLPPMKTGPLDVLKLLLLNCN